MGNEYGLYLKSSEGRAKRDSAERSIYIGIIALAFVLALWLADSHVASAASGTPWHTQADSLSGEVLPVWELWRNAFDSNTWESQQQSWVTDSIPWLVAPHPTIANSALAAGPLGVHRTLDGGETWTHLPGIVDPVIAIAYDAQNPQVVYAGTELAGTYRSEDGGLYWGSIDTGLPRDRLGNVAGAVALAADPTASSTLFAATTTAGGLYRSQDVGSSWRLANSGLPEEPVLGLDVSASRPVRLYAVTSSSLFLSSNRAGRWSLVGASPTETAQELLLEPNTLNSLLLVAESALYRSTNGGVSWVELDIPAEITPISDAWFVRGGSYTYLFVAGAGGPYWQRITPVSPQSPPQTESETETYVEVTGHTIREPFLAFFNANGGVGRFGYPRTDAIDEDGKTVQYFQRSRLEIVSNEDGEHVVQSPLGTILRTGADPSVASSQSTSSSTQTQYAVDQVFINFYASNNGRESLGSPIAPAADEVQVNGATLYTQYFEFARLEHHSGAESPILLGLIGDEYLTQKGWLQ